MDVQQEMQRLTALLEEANRLYYELDAPTMPDFEYDRLLRQLETLEAEHPELASPVSPTRRVGGQALSRFEKVEHAVPLESLQDVFSEEELTDFDTHLRETVPGDLDNFIFTIQERMREYAEQKGLILACGPLPFLKTVHGFARELNARVQLSLENRMACGVGACLGCVTRTTEEWPVADKRNGLVQTCNHGPVFWANQIEL